MSNLARRAALECVLAVVRDDAYANLVLPTILSRRALEGRDARFATELAYGSLRMQGWYDAVITSAARRPSRDLDPTVRCVLWLGAHQALAMNTPPHAAVSETVDLAVRAGAGRAKGLVNAVMRRITERSSDAWRAVLAPGSSRDAIALRTSHSDWVARELAASLAAHGRAGDLEALLEAHNQPAQVTLAVRPSLMDRDHLVHEVNGTPTSLSPYGVVMSGGNVGAVESVAQGKAGAQDEGSQLVAAVLASAAARPTSPDERWLDMCAGPGGKTALLGSLAAQTGATLDATELHPHRAELVRRNVRALPSGVVRVIEADATAYQGGPYDRILLDAPCTGLGALRRRPEARWRKHAADLTQLTQLQRRLLEHAQTLLAPGGVIAYVTCSPVLAETRAVAQNAGLAMPDARSAFAQVTGSPASQWGSGPDVQLFTHVHGTDSMYVALLSKPGGR